MRGGPCDGAPVLSHLRNWICLDCEVGGTSAPPLACWLCGREPYDLAPGNHQFCSQVLLAILPRLRKQKQQPEAVA